MTAPRTTGTSGTGHGQPVFLSLSPENLKHTTLATARLRFLFLAAKIVRHAGAVLVRYSDHYAEQGIFARLMDRLRSIVPGHCFAPVVPTPLRL